MSARISKLRMGELLLVVTAFVQAIFLLLAIRERIQSFRGVGGLPAIERSVRIAFGDDFASFVGFLREGVPEDGRLAVPPMDLEPTFGDVGLVQYFLFPRQIVNCPSGDDLPACVRSLTGPRTCILRVGDFPAAEDVPSNKVYIRFDAERGLYCPP